MQQEVQLEVPQNGQKQIPHATPSSTLESPSNNSSLEEASDDSTPRKYKSLADIYATCQYALTVVDPMYYKEAAEKKEWQQAMVEKMQAIEKNNT